MPAQAHFCAQCGTAVDPADGGQSREAESAVEQEDESLPAERAGEVEPEFVATTVAAPPTDEPQVPLPMPENLAAVVGYLTILPAIIFLYLEPFRRNRFVRFHAVQHLLLFVAAVACFVAASVLWTILQLIPFMRVLVFPFAGLIGLAWFFLWLLLVVKAYHHEWFKLPYLGEYAEEWS